MWGWPAVEMKPDKAYRCTECDVYGKGDACWMCGSTEVKFGQWASAATGHHHDPSVTAVSASTAGQIAVDPTVVSPW